MAPAHGNIEHEPVGGDPIRPSVVGRDNRRARPGVSHWRWQSAHSQRAARTNALPPCTANLPKSGIRQARIRQGM